MGGLDPLVVFWSGWGIHVTVLVSFTVQVTLLLLADIRRRQDWTWLKVVIWSAYTLADTTAIYALGHMSALCSWSPEHLLMALWAPLLLVHLGGQDNITAYAMADNRLWLRHLQTCVLQVALAGYVMHVSSILSQPSKLRSAAILMFVVGVLKYGERMWAIMAANSCCSSSLSARSYKKALSVGSRSTSANLTRPTFNETNRRILILAHSLLDVPKKMFEGPTTYVQISSSIVENNEVYEEKYILDVVEMQLSMMYDLLYTKAAVVHSWYGLCSRVLISLPFTVAAFALFLSLLSHDKDDVAAAAYRRVDVTVTNVLLIGAVVLEIMSVLRAIFSKWTAVLLYGIEWDTVGNMVLSVALIFNRAILRAMRFLSKKKRAIGFCLDKLRRRFCCASFSYDRIVVPSTVPWWLGRMGQHSLFDLMNPPSKHSVCRKMAKGMGLEDWWDSNVNSWSTGVPELVINKVLELVSSATTIEEITTSWGQNAVRQKISNEYWRKEITMELEMKLEDVILVWHIATHIYTWLYNVRGGTKWKHEVQKVRGAANVLADYMFFLLATRPYMLPYPVSRQTYAKLCTNARTHLRYCSFIQLHKAVLNQKAALRQGTPLQPDEGKRIKRPQNDAAAVEPQLDSMNIILDKACQLAAKLFHITDNRTEETVEGIIAEQAESTVSAEDTITEPAETTFSVNGEVVLNMVLEVWVEMLCYTAYICNENSHAKHLTNGGEIMTFITLTMIYKKKGLFRTATRPSSSQRAGATAVAESSSSQTTATATDIESGRT